MSMMTSSRLVRGTKGRLFAGLGLLIIFAGIVTLYHSTRVELNVVQSALSKCHQEQDSLAAQVQVISEYKKNLEKSLNQEKAEHRQAKEELLTQMNDEQHLRNKEKLENVNKYKALQQQYKLLQSEHEDLSELCNKARADQASCAEALSHMDTQLSTFQQDLARKDEEIKSLKLKYLKLEEENKSLLQRLHVLPNSNEFGQDNKSPSANNKRSSTKSNVGDDSALAAHNVVSNVEQLRNVLPIAQKSSTAAQDEMLQPARPAQPGLLQPGLPKTSGNQSTSTSGMNQEIEKSHNKIFHEAAPALPIPLMLSPQQQHVSVEKQDFANNGPQGVLPAPLGFGSDNHYAQNALPLQAPYKLHGLGHQEVPQNQGQMPPLAAGASGSVGNNVLPAPPDHAHDLIQHLPKFNQLVQQNMNPFRNDVNLRHHDVMSQQQETQMNHPDQNPHKFGFNDHMFHLNGLKAHDALNSIYNLQRPFEIHSGGKIHGAQLAFAGHGAQADNSLPLHKSGMKDVNIVPLDGDINQHRNLELPGGVPFAGLHHPNLDSAHGQVRAQPIGQQEVHHGGHYNHYQGGDYDKEDVPANNEAEDEDLDQIDYNNEPNQAHPVQHIHQAQKIVHRGLADRHQDGVMVNPR